MRILPWQTDGHVRSGKGRQGRISIDFPVLRLPSTMRSTSPDALFTVQNHCAAACADQIVGASPVTRFFAGALEACLAVLPL